MERRQVSLLCTSSIEKMRRKGADVGPGDFAENLTVTGFQPGDMRLSDRFRLERGPLLEITQIGKKCHSECEIARQVGECVMPREGVFARVVEGGQVFPGDWIEVIDDED
jgi:MOSC domain-containing protein YiiM